MDFSGIPPIGAKALVSGPLAAHPHPEKVNRVEGSAKASDAGNKAGQHPDQEAQAAPGRDILALRRAVARGDRPAGPPPSFDVSILEVERDLKEKLARMEQARAQARDMEAFRAEARDAPAADDRPGNPDDAAPADPAAPAQAVAAPGAQATAEARGPQETDPPTPERET